GPAAPPGSLMDREGPPQQGIPSFRHGHLHELARLGLVGDVRSHQGDGVIGPGASIRQDFAVGSDHAVSSLLIETTGIGSSSTRVSCSPIIGEGRAAWYSWRERGDPPPARIASIPCTAARIPGTVV